MKLARGVCVLDVVRDGARIVRLVRALAPSAPVLQRTRAERPAQLIDRFRYHALIHSAAISASPSRRARRGLRYSPATPGRRRRR